MNGNQRRMKVTGSLLLVLALVITVAAFVFGGDNKSGPGNGTTTTSAPADDGKDVIDALTVRTVSMSCTDGRHGKVTKAGKSKLVSYDIGALKPVREGGRLWSDALSNPLKGDTDLERLRSLETAICRDPLVGATVANLFANMRVGRVEVVDLNDWLKPFQGSARRVNDRAASFIPLMDEEDPSDTEVAKGKSANLRYQQLAAKLNTLVSRFAINGVKAERSTLNYHLVAGGLVAGGLPEVGLNPRQEALPALVLELTAKGACKPLKRVGFNLFDKRPEVFSVPACEQPPATTTTPPSGGCRHNCGGTTTTTVVTTTTSCASGKCTPPTTVSPPPTTRPPAVTTTQPDNGGQGDSGDGATNTTTPPTTSAPPATVPVTSSPTTNPPMP